MKSIPLTDKELELLEQRGISFSPDFSSATLSTIGLSWLLNYLDFIRPRPTHFNTSILKAIAYHQKTLGSARNELQCKMIHMDFEDRVLHAANNDYFAYLVYLGGTPPRESLLIGPRSKHLSPNNPIEITMYLPWTPDLKFPIFLNFSAKEIQYLDMERSVSVE